MKKLVLSLVVMFLVLPISLLGEATKIDTTKEYGPVLTRILKKGELVVLNSPDYPPYSTMKVTGATSEVVGFDIDVAQVIADYLGVKLTVQPMSFNSIVSSLASGIGDLGISGFTPTEERKQTVDFSITYTNGNQTYIVNSNVADKIKTEEDLKNFKVGYQMGSLQEQLANQLGLTNTLALKDISVLASELSTGKLDAVIVSESNGKSLVKVHPNTQMGTFILDEENSEGVAIAVPKGNEDLVAILDEILLGLMNEGKIDEMFSNAEAYVNELNQVESNVTPGAKLNFGFVPKYFQYFMGGTAMTLLISLVTVLLGTILGYFIARGRLSNIKIINWILTGWITILRGTPLLVQVLIVTIGLPRFGIEFPDLQLAWLPNSRLLFGAMLALVLNSSAYVSEIFRGGIQNVDGGLIEASRSLGLSKKQTMKLITLPIAIKNVLPALGNEFIVMVKESSIVSVIGVSELMFRADVVSSATYLRLESLLVAAAIYLIINTVLTWLLGIYERKVSLYDKN